MNSLRESPVSLYRVIKTPMRNCTGVFLQQFPSNNEENRPTSIHTCMHAWISDCHLFSSNPVTTVSSSQERIVITVFLVRSSVRISLLEQSSFSNAVLLLKSRLVSWLLPQFNQISLGFLLTFKLVSWFPLQTRDISVSSPLKDRLPFNLQLFQ